MTGTAEQKMVLAGSVAASFSCVEELADGSVLPEFARCPVAGRQGADVHDSAAPFLRRES